MEPTNRTQSTDADRGRIRAEAAEIYESFFVPALFGQFATALVELAGVEAGQRVLDVGCGTGAAARAALQRVGRGGEVVGVDPNEGMLAVARRVEPSIGWRSGAAELLPFDHGCFDHTLCGFAAMFFDDREKALQEMARVTCPGGTVTVATWAALERTPGYEAMVALIEAELGREAADALRAPFVLGETRSVEQLLAPIGDSPRVRELPGSARFASVRDWVHTDVRGWTLADLVDDDAESALVARAERHLSAFVSPDGSVEFDAPALMGTVMVEW